MSDSPIWVDPTYVAEARDLLGSAPDAMRAEIGDSLADLFNLSDAQITNALRDQRRQVVVRTNGALQSGAISREGWDVGIGHSDGNPAASRLVPEGDGFHFQAIPGARWWDPAASVTVLRSGVEQTIGEDVTINHRDGRVTFTSEVADGEPVLAAFSYYRVLRAVKALIARQSTVLAGIGSLKGDGFTLQMGAVSDRMLAIDALIATTEETVVQHGKRIY